MGRTLARTYAEAVTPPAPSAPRDSSRLVPPRRAVVRVAVTTDPLDVDEHARLVDDAAAGAVVTFAGVVRDHDGGRGVTGIEYVGHPDAAAVLERVVTDAVATLDVDAVAVTHRLGPLAVGECALALAVSSAHRSEAFEAAAQLVDAVKEHLPVWKRQDLAGGGEEWVGSA